jgi:phage terminase large subunit-like protein
MASLLICHLCGPVAVRNSQLYSCAMAKDQAAVIFRYAQKMVQMSPALSARIRMQPSVKTMTCPGTGVTFKVLASDDKVTYGLSPQVTFFDETGQAGPRYPLWDAMETAKGAVFNGLTVIISTQAATDDAILSVLLDDAENDPEVYVQLMKCPDDIDPLDVDRLHEWFPAWHEAWCNTKEIISQCKRAARLPSERSRFLNLFANWRVRAEAGLFTPEVWKACGGDFDRQAALKRKAWGGLDLSVTTDLTAWVLVIPMDDGTFGVKAQFFLPAEGIDERELKDRAPYREWAEKGFLTLCPGAVIGYEWVLEQIAQDAADYDIQEIAYDRYKMKVLKKAAEDAGIELPTMVEHGQGFVSMASSITELENVVLKKELRHAGHPVLQNNIANAVIVKDPAGNRKFDKSKRTQRIDGAVALAMAVGQYHKSSHRAPEAAGMIG